MYQKMKWNTSCSHTITIFFTVSMPYLCDSCTSHFDNKNLYISHKKKCIPTGTVITYLAEKLTLHHNESRVFLCYCSHPDCLKLTGFTIGEGILKHMKKLQTKWMGVEKKVGMSYCHECIVAHTITRTWVVNPFSWQRQVSTICQGVMSPP